MPIFRSHVIVVYEKEIRELMIGGRQFRPNLRRNKSIKLVQISAELGANQAFKQWCQRIQDQLQNYTCYSSQINFKFHPKNQQRSLLAAGGTLQNWKYRIKSDSYQHPKSRTLQIIRTIQHQGSLVYCNVHTQYQRYQLSSVSNIIIKQQTQAKYQILNQNKIEIGSEMLEQLRNNSEEQEVNRQKSFEKADIGVSKDEKYLSEKKEMWNNVSHKIFDFAGTRDEFYIYRNIVADNQATKRYNSDLLNPWTQKFLQPGQPSVSFDILEESEQRKAPSSTPRFKVSLVQSIIPEANESQKNNEEQHQSRKNTLTQKMGMTLAQGAMLKIKCVKRETLLNEGIFREFLANGDKQSEDSIDSMKKNLENQKDSTQRRPTIHFKVKVEVLENFILLHPLPDLNYVQNSLQISNFTIQPFPTRYRQEYQANRDEFPTEEQQTATGFSQKSFPTFSPFKNNNTNSGNSVTFSALNKIDGISSIAANENPLFLPKITRQDDSQSKQTSDSFENKRLWALDLSKLLYVDSQQIRETQNALLEQGGGSLLHQEQIIHRNPYQPKEYHSITKSDPQNSIIYLFQNPWQEESESHGLNEAYLFCLSIHEQQLQHCTFDVNKTINLRENHSALNSAGAASLNIKQDEEEDDECDFKNNLTFSQLKKGIQALSTTDARINPLDSVYKFIKQISKGLSGQVDLYELIDKNLDPVLRPIAKSNFEKLSKANQLRGKDDQFEEEKQQPYQKEQSERIMKLSQGLQNQRGTLSLFWQLKYKQQALRQAEGSSQFTQQSTQGSQVIVKTYDKDALVSRILQEHVRNEVINLRLLKTDLLSNVIQIETVYESDKEIKVVTAFAGEENLKTLILKMEREHIEICSSFIRNIMRELFKGISEIHRKHIVHRDLKPENVIVQVKGGGENVNVQIADFGISCFLSQDLDYDLNIYGDLVGTPGYIDPHLLKVYFHRSDKKYSNPGLIQKIDLFAAGCIFFYLLYGFPLICGSDFEDILNSNIHFDPKEIQQYGNILSFTAGAKKLLLGLLELNLGKRLTADEALSSDYFTECDPPPPSQQQQQSSSSSSSQSPTPQMILDPLPFIFAVQNSDEREQMNDNDDVQSIPNKIIDREDMLIIHRDNKNLNAPPPQGRGDNKTMLHPVHEAQEEDEQSSSVGGSRKTNKEKECTQQNKSSNNSQKSSFSSSNPDNCGQKNGIVISGAAECDEEKKKEMGEEKLVIIKFNEENKEENREENKQDEEKLFWYPSSPSQIKDIKVENQEESDDEEFCNNFDIESILGLNLKINSHSPNGMQLGICSSSQEQKTKNLSRQKVGQQYQEDDLFSSFVKGDDECIKQLDRQSLSKQAQNVGEITNKNVQDNEEDEEGQFQDQDDSDEFNSRDQQCERLFKMSEIEAKIINRLSIGDVVNGSDNTSEELKESSKCLKPCKSAEQNRFLSKRNSRVVYSPLHLRASQFEQCGNPRFMKEKERAAHSVEAVNCQGGGGGGQEASQQKSYKSNKSYILKHNNCL